MAKTLGNGAIFVSSSLGGELGSLASFCESEAGLRVRAVGDAREALRQAALLRPALLVTELMLPGLDGLSLCRALREEPALRECRVLAVSTLAAERQALQSGADAFQQRPCEARALIASAARLLGWEEVSASAVA